MDGVDVNGQPLDIPGVPTKADLDALAAEELALSKPLDEERMTVQSHRRNGTVETKEVKLGDTMQWFENLEATKRAELESLRKELKDVDEEIAAAKEDVVKMEKKQVKKAKGAFNDELNSLIDQAEAVKNQTLAEIKKAQEEEESAKAERSQKMREFMESLF